MRKPLIIATIVLFASAAGAFYKGPADNIRVLISKGQPEVVIKGSLIIEPLDTANGRGGRVLSSTSRISSGGDFFLVDGNSLNASALKVTSEGRAIEFKGREYDGAFNIYKGDGGLITVVNVLPIEEYLLGLVASEMPTDWPIEAVKAQAVIARSYAMYQRNMKAQGVSSGRHDVEAGVQDQVYQGKRGVNKRVEDAVSSTKGEILKKNGRLVKAFFHSTCGGATEKASNVWGEKNDFLAVKDEFCSRSPYSSWTYRITKRELAEKLAANGFPGSFVGSISIENRKENPRAATVIVESGGQTFYIQANEFRRIVGYAKLKSAWFSVSSEGEDIIFSGKGFGHGVGLCQWGAKGMAEARKDYREILKYYYPGTEISGQ